VPRILGVQQRNTLCWLRFSDVFRSPSPRKMLGHSLMFHNDTFFPRLFRIHRPLASTTQNYTSKITGIQNSALSHLQFLLAVSWQQLLTTEIFQLSALRSSLSRQPVQNTCQLTTQLNGSQAGGCFTPTS
jgi:hypothetical protein